MATARAAQLRDGIRDDVRSLVDKLTGALAQLERTADPRPPKRSWKPGRPKPPRDR